MASSELPHILVECSLAAKNGGSSSTLELCYYSSALAAFILQENSIVCFVFSSQTRWLTELVAGEHASLLWVQLTFASLAWDGTSRVAPNGLMGQTMHWQLT